MLKANRTTHLISNFADSTGYKIWQSMCLEKSDDFVEVGKYMFWG